MLPAAQRALQIASMNVYLKDFIRPGQSPIVVETFSYNVGPIAVATNATVSTLFETQSDSDFLLEYLSGYGSFGTLDTDQDYQPLALMQLTDTGSGKRYFNAAGPMALVAGNQGYPFILPTPRMLMPNSQIRIDLTNSLAADEDFYVTFSGLRIYYSTPQTAVSAALATA